MRHLGFLVVAAVCSLTVGSASAQMFVDQKNLSSEAGQDHGQGLRGLGRRARLESSNRLGAR